MIITSEFQLFWTSLPYILKWDFHCVLGQYSGHIATFFNKSLSIFFVRQDTALSHNLDTQNLRASPLTQIIDPTKFITACPAL